MLARAPLALADSLDAGAVDQQMQGALALSVGNGDRQVLLAPAERAEIRNRQIKSGQLQKACHQPGRLAQRQPEQRFQRKAGLDRGVGERRRPTATAPRRRQPIHPGVKPDQQRPALLQGRVAGAPVGRAVAWRRRLAHPRPLTGPAYKGNSTG